MSRLIFLVAYHLEVYVRFYILDEKTSTFDRPSPR